MCTAFLLLQSQHKKTVLRTASLRIDQSRSPYERFRYHKYVTYKTCF